VVFGLKSHNTLDMAECNKDCDEKKQKEMERLFEGEYDAVLVGDEENWLWGEDEEFQFDREGGNKWFEDAFDEGMAECALMRGVQKQWRWKDGMEEERWCAQKRVMDEYEESVKEEENEAFERLKVKMEVDEKNKKNKQSIEENVNKKQY
jgi:hypothetical protein